LEMYFNEVPYGGSTYGVEEAAQKNNIHLMIYTFFQM